MKLSEILESDFLKKKMYENKMSTICLFFITIKQKINLKIWFRWFNI